MKHFSEQFNKQSKSVSLQAVEREMLRSKVVSYMEYHPLPATAQKVKKSIPSPFGDTFKVVQIPTGLILRWSAAFSVLLLVVIPVLAEQAVPGDSLYAVKVRFNEEVRSSLTLDQHAKVEWETKRLNRRIAEARQLASEGKLTPEVEVQMVAAVREHTQNVQKEIDTLRTSDADGATLASIELNTTLEAQSASLQEEGKTTLATAVSDAVSTTNSNQLLVDVLNETISKQDDQPDATIPSYDKIMARIEQNTTRSYELLNSIKFTDKDPLKTSLDRRLQDVNHSIEDANNIKSKDEAAASKELIDALERTQKLIVFMSAIDANRSVDLESVVPVILTTDEKQQLAMQLSAEIGQKIETIEALRPKLSASVAGKVDAAVVAAKKKQEEIKADTSKVINRDVAKDTFALLDDALGVIAASGISTTVPATPTIPDTKNASSTSPTSTTTPVKVETPE
jgi:Domain of unknown function (DUF5667)